MCHKLQEKTKDCMKSFYQSICLLLCLLSCQLYDLAAQNIVTYAGNSRAERFNSVMQLSDGTFLVAGKASNLNWVVGSPVFTELDPLNIDNVGVVTEEFNIGFLLRISEDLQQILQVVHFPERAVVDITHIKSDNLPGSATGNLYISGRTAAGYFLARLNNNFVGGVPTALDWAWNVEASGYHRTDQPWDVGSDGKVVFAAGTPDGYDWAAVYRLRADGSGLDVVPNWRYHFGINRDNGQPAEGAWTPAYSNPDVATTGSAVVYKADTRCALRSWDAGDYNAVLPDGNGATKQGRWPMDVFYAGPCNIDNPNATQQLGGYTGYRKGDADTHRIGGIAVDKRNNHIYIGSSINSITSGGQPDFEPMVVAFTDNGSLKWWSRLYTETPQQSPPDQFVDGLTVNYAQNSLVVLGRQHGNAPQAFWSGTGTVHDQFTGTNGNIQVSWVGKLALNSGDFVNASYVAGYNGGGALGAPYADPILDGWPDHNQGWADLNTARGSINLKTDLGGNLYLLANARAFVTTSNAYQKHQKPADGPSAWASNVRVYEPDFSTLLYSSALTGVNPEAGSGGGNTRMMDVWGVPGGLILVGYQFGNTNGSAQGTNIPLANIPPWGTNTAQFETAILARLTYSELEAVFYADPPGGNCVGQTTVFTDSSYSSSDNIVSWQWDFGEGATPPSANTRGPHEVSWATPGPKTVSLVVTDGLGNTDTTTMEYQIDPLPPAGININPPSPASPAPVTASLTPQGGVDANLSYFWEIEDLVEGTVTYTSGDPTHIFQMAGDYLIRLRTSNGTCTAIDSIVYTVEGGPGPIDPEFTVTPESPCLGEPVIFEMVNDTNIVSYDWYFGEGATPASANTAGPHTVFFTTPGEKTALLTVSNGVVELTHVLTFLVTEAPSAAFTMAGDPSNIPANFTFTPVAGQVPGYSYEWDFGFPQDTTDNNSEGYTAGYEYQSAGLYHVGLTVTTPGGCSKTFFDSLRIEGGVDTLAADFTFVNSSRTCVFNTVTFTDMSRGYEGNTRTWYFDATATIDDTADVASPVESTGPVDVFWTTPGIKRVTLIVDGGTPDATKVYSELIEVFPYPIADFNFSGNTCEAPADITFTAERAPGNYYEWDFGDGSPTVNASEVTHTYSAEGEYEVTLTVTNNGCTSKATRLVVIGECDPPLLAGIQIRQARQDCGSQRYIIESITRGTISGWDWNLGAGLTPSNLEGPGPHQVTVNPDAGRPIEITLTVTDEDGNTSTVTTEID